MFVYDGHIFTFSLQVQSSYLLIVRAYDSGTPPLSSECRVNITVVEPSKFPPTVYPLRVTIFSYKNAYKGGIIGKINAVDTDPHDVLTYNVLQDTSRRQDVEYFDVDAEYGTLMAVMPLDAGQYSVNVAVSDGKFMRNVDVSVVVHVLTQNMVDNTVIVSIGPVTPESFVVRHKDTFIRTIASELYLSEKQIHVVSLQSTHHPDSVDRFRSYEPSVDNNEPKEQMWGQRTKRQTEASHLDILLLMEKNDKEFYGRNESLKMLGNSLKRIKRRLPFSDVGLMSSKCFRGTECSTNGNCVDVIHLRDEGNMPLNTKLGSVVALQFEHNFGCKCQQGFGGEKCDAIVNACGRKPCSKYHVCTPTDLITKGFICHCEKGLTGSKCDVKVGECDDMSCYHPVRPLSFNGNSFAQYSVPHIVDSRSIQLSLNIRTNHEAGTVVYSRGTVDYNILEIKNGFLQFRWNTGSGEGLVIANSVKINNLEWHSVNLTRIALNSSLVVDGYEFSDVSPGPNEVMSLDWMKFYIGAEVFHSENEYSKSSVERGFVGCIDEVSLDGQKLPLSMGPSKDTSSLRRFVNVDLSCSRKVAVSDICNSYPCMNGGKCLAKGDTFECQCQERFAGEVCDIDKAPCLSSPCLNNGVCVAIGSAYTCKCPAQLSGKRCEYGLHCNPNPCLNGGVCEEGTSAPFCKCGYFTGERCQKDFNECKHNPCMNGGTCVNFYGGFRCVCPSKTAGEFCNEVFVSHSDTFTVSILDVIIALVVILLFTLCVILILYCRKRKRNQKKQLQNNTIKLTDHVMNDLKACDDPNGKICNVQANQRPRSLLANGAEGLKPWNDDVIELDLIARASYMPGRDSQYSPLQRSPPLRQGGVCAPSSDVLYHQVRAFLNILVCIHT